MIPYFAVFVALSLSSLLQLDRVIKYYKSLFLLLCFSVLAILAGVRSSSVGADYNNYRRFFEDFNGVLDGGIKQILDFNGYFFEPAFAGLIVFSKSLSSSHVFFFVLVSALTAILMLVGLRRLTAYPLLSLLVFYSYDFFTNFMVAIRFGVAVALTLFVLIFIAKRMHWASLFLIFSASLFHTSALVLIIPFLTSFLNLGRRALSFGFLGTLVVGYLGLGKSIFSALLPSFIPRADSVLAYISSSKYGETLGFFGLVNIKYIVLMFLTLAFWDRLIKRYRYFSVVALFLFWAVAFRVGLHGLGFIVGRVSALLGIVEIILVPWLCFSVLKSPLASWFLVLSYSFLHLLMILFLHGYTEYSAVIFSNF